MEILILSCDSGGGHDAAAMALMQKLHQRGHHVSTENVMRFSKRKLGRKFGPIYVHTVQKTPLIFGMIYYIGAAVAKLPIRSPVYYGNRKVGKKLAQYMQTHPADVAVATHTFAAEALTYMKDKSLLSARTVMISTDYTCAPFIEETKCDNCVIPHETLREEFCKKKITAEQIQPLGIPVHAGFSAQEDQRDAKRRLGLAQDKRYYLILGGSMGAGGIKRLAAKLSVRLRLEENVIVICGSNQKLRSAMSRRYADCEQVQILGRTDEMHTYMHACDVLFSKPGGLSSTEAAVAGIAMVHMSPIPGCESRNRKFFRDHGMSCAPRSVRAQVEEGCALMVNAQRRAQMREQQRACINAHAAQDICDLIERCE